MPKRIPHALGMLLVLSAGHALLANAAPAEKLAPAPTIYTNLTVIDGTGDRQPDAAAYRAGVAISSGTDFTPPADDPYPALHLELETLVRDVGMTPADALRAATSAAARALKADDRMGTLAAGKLANLVIVSRNPLDDITALREVVLTIKRGRAYPRSDYHQPDPKILSEDF